MQVKETVFRMMRLVPSLYPTRVQTLKALFDSSYCQWVNGELINSDWSGNELDFLPYRGESFADTEDRRKVSDVIFYRRENAKAQFVYDNAYLLSHEQLSRFRKNSFIRFEGLHFADLPKDVTPDWLDAAKELAQCISIHKYEPDVLQASDYVKNGMKQHEESVKICHQFLERFRVITPCPYARAARIRELTREALALGLHLLDEEGKPPKTAV